MDSSAWDILAAELFENDQCGEFAVAHTHPKAKRWPEVTDHPVNMIVNGCASAENHINILIRALDDLELPGHLEMVVRALTRKGMMTATPRLLQFFCDFTWEDRPQLLWAVGNAIYTIAPRDHLAECIEICRERRFGYARRRLVVHLCRYKKSEDAFHTLLSLLDDESVRGSALEALKRFGDVRAIPTIENTPVRDGDEGIYETHQKEMALKMLRQQQATSRN